MEYRLYYQRHLPHFQPPGATLFITFRLAGSLPPEVLRRLTEETRIKQREIDLLPDPANEEGSRIPGTKKALCTLGLRAGHTLQNQP